MAVSKRIRRTPEEARRVILDAAEASMAAHGPAGIRLQDVARAAGVSHPGILHHFGSREGLILALNQRTLEDLKTVLTGVIRASHGSQDAVGPTFAAYRNGLAQRMLWLLQAQAVPAGARLPLFDEIVAQLHALRVELAGPGVVVEEFDSRAVVHLTILAAFGDAIIGPRLRRAANAKDEAALRQRFEDWFSLLLNAYVSGKSAA